jgi:hypothetical protein
LSGSWGTTSFISRMDGIVYCGFVKVAPSRLIPVFLGAGFGLRDGTPWGDRNGMVQLESMGVEKKQEGYGELLVSIRRLTIMVLDNLEEGTRDRVLDQGQKRLLSSIGVRLLRLWRAALREGGSERLAGELDKIQEALSLSSDVKREGAVG